jgi:hypothetical protein
LDPVAQREREIDGQLGLVQKIKLAVTLSAGFAGNSLIYLVRMKGLEPSLLLQN